MTKPLDSSRSCVAQAEELLKKVKLWQKRELQVEILSHGEKRQLEIVLSLACRPKVLLLDEPSAGLTSGESIEVAELIRGLMEDTTVLFAAHDLDLVYELSDRVLVLYYGHILAQGTPEEIQNDPKVQEIYLGTEAKVARTD
jgi:branched-chain amino acid transport system ATP-binding protein